MFVFPVVVSARSPPFRPSSLSPFSTWLNLLAKTKYTWGWQVAVVLSFQCHFIGVLCVSWIFVVSCSVAVPPGFCCSSRAWPCLVSVWLVQPWSLCSFPVCFPSTPELRLLRKPSPVPCIFTTHQLLPCPLPFNHAWPSPVFLRHVNCMVQEVKKSQDHKSQNNSSSRDHEYLYKLAIH